jgi:hypothetical protein
MFPKGTINGYFDPHDQGMGSKLTAAPIDPAGSHWATSKSLDWVAAGLVNPNTKSPLVLSVVTAFSNVKGIVSYQDAQTPFAPETNPQNVYSSLTGLFTSGTTTPADYRVLQGNSIWTWSRAIWTPQALNMSAPTRRRSTTGSRCCGKPR